MPLELRTRDDVERSIMARVIERNHYDLGDDLSGAVVLDVGAHAGGFSVACLLRGAEAVYCFEPDPGLAELCGENLAATGMAGTPHVDVAAVWADESPEDGLVMSRLVADDSGSGSVVYEADGDAPSQTVPVADIDEILQAINHEHRSPVTIMKMDCEGAEYQILYNSRCLDIVQDMVVEFHEIELPLRAENLGSVDPSDMNGKALSEFLLGMGFHVIGKMDIDTGTIWASRDPEHSPFACFAAEQTPTPESISVNLIAGSGANQGPGAWIFSRMAREIADRVNARGDVQITLTAAPDSSRFYDVYHYLHSTLAVQQSHMLHRSIVTVHAMDTESEERTFQHKKATLERVPMVTCVSPSILRELIDKGIPADKLRFTPQGVDLNAFAPPSQDARWSDVRLGIVGRRYDDGKKGERFLCDVLKLLSSMLPDGVRVTVVFVGPNWETGPIETLMGDGALPNVGFEFLGVLDEAGVAEAYRNMDACLVTSRCNECGPMCTMEALATGIPVVSTPSGNALHFLSRTDGTDTLGAIVAYGDVDGFARAILGHVVENLEVNRTAERRLERSKSVREVEDGTWRSPAQVGEDPFAPYSWQSWADAFADLYLELASSLRGKVMVSDYLSEEDQASFRQNYRTGASEMLNSLYVRNFMQVMPYARAGIGLVSLTDKLHRRPAIIVGMGPSLDACMDLLRACQEDVAIIACDASLRKLLAADIRPAMVVVADPSDRQVENFSGVDGTQFVTALPTVVHPMVFHSTRKSDCRTVWYNIADGNQEICQHIPKVVGNKGAIQPAVLTTGMAYIAALHLGCSPITFIGSDLCWYDLDRGYATGVSPSKAEWQRRNKMFGNPVMLFPDVVGRTVVTEPCFMAFWQWMNDYLEFNDLTVYNSSGCGILHGERIIQTPLDLWIESSLSRTGTGPNPRAALIEAYEFARRQLDVMMCHQLEEGELADLRSWAVQDLGEGPTP